MAVYKIHLFAGLADLCGGHQIEISFPASQITVQDLISTFREQYPAGKSLLNESFIAVNFEYASNDTVVSESDEIAVIPPVSGG